DIKSTLLFFSGRAHDSVGVIKKLSLAYPHVRIVSFNYRSYGRSEGVASEENILNDGVKIAQLVKKNYGDFYILGYSLGSSVASYVATKVECKAIFLVGVFDSIASIAKEKFVVRSFFPMIDLSNIFRYKFNNKEHLKEVDAHTYILVSKDDETTYIQNARNLKSHVKNLVVYEEYDNLSHKELLWDDKVIDKINGVLK
ncbi:MAG: alpha/beta hydrolase, partial [Epsilonproteobacteria bacterium]